jgi:hypothetical protein
MFLVAIDHAELLGIEVQLSGHLDVGIGKTVALSRFDPR